jgi:hypothetical protein
MGCGEGVGEGEDETATTQFMSRKSRYTLAVLVNEKSVKEFSDTSQRWMTAWVEEAKASTENSLIFMAGNSRTLEKLRALIAIHKIPFLLKQCQ